MILYPKYQYQEPPTGRRSNNEKKKQNLFEMRFADVHGGCRLPLYICVHLDMAGPAGVQVGNGTAGSAQRTVDHRSDPLNREGGSRAGTVQPVPLLEPS